MAASNVYSFDVQHMDGEPTDETLVREILGGDVNQLSVLMRRHNQRLYRVCRSIVANDGEAEEAVQEAYLRAYKHLQQFRGESKFSTWLTRIAIFESLARRRRLARLVDLDSDRPVRPQLVAKGRGPEKESMNRELAEALETAIDALPENYRTVFVLRHIEELSTDETAECLNLGREAVKSRLLRSRLILQEKLRPHVIEEAAAHAYRFLGPRCARVIEKVFSRLSPLAG